MILNLYRIARYNTSRTDIYDDCFEARSSCVLKEQRRRLCGKKKVRENASYFSVNRGSGDRRRRPNFARAASGDCNNKMSFKLGY